MNNDRPNYTMLVLFIGLAIVGFLLWVGGIFAAWTFLRAKGMSADFWTVLSALSTAVAAATVLSAGFVAYRELLEVSSSRHMEVAVRLFDELNSPENIAARRWVYQHLPEDPKEGIPGLSEEGRAAVKQVLNSLDHVAFLTQAGWIPDDIIMPWMHPMIFKSWQKLEGYVKLERDRRDEPLYYINLDHLAARCQKWRAQHHVRDEVNWVGDAL